MLLAAQRNRKITQRLAAELAEVEGRFAAELISDLPCVNSLVSHIERYRGKMFRPMLVLLGGMAASPTGSDVTDAHRVVATVVEMVHMATLVHDDILDDARVRRGGKTINELSGNETAVMLGDYLISHAYHLCSSLDGPAAAVMADSDPACPTVSRLIADATNTVCEGELLQLANRNNWNLDEGTYFQIIRRKTASLCGASCRVAALLHGASPDVVERLHDYGEKVGTAFQIVDDLLDLLGDEDTVGKTLGRDFDKGKLTLPIIRHLQSAPAAQSSRLLELISNGDGNGSVARDGADFGRQMRELVIASGSVAYATDWAGRLIQQARAAAMGLADSPARALLLDMADAVRSRNF